MGYNNAVLFCFESKTSNWKLGSHITYILLGGVLKMEIPYWHFLQNAEGVRFSNMTLC